MSVALGLYRLQQVDSQLDQIHARLKTIRETLENDLELRAANKTVSSSDGAHKETSVVLKHSEAEVEKQRLKIEQTEASLYSGSVKNPKELQDLQMDVASLKKHLATLEERELEAMIRAEETEKGLASAKKKLEDVQSKIKDQNSDLSNESDTLNKDMERLETERKAISDDLAEQATSTYEQLRRQKRGVAVALLSEEACSACGTTFTASQQQNARTAAEFFYCPTCGRIIYAG